MSGGKTVCHISFNHQLFDDRIYWKELLSLKQAGYNAVHISVTDKDDDFFTNDGIRLISIKRVKLSKNVYINRVLQTIFKRKGTINKILEIASTLNASIYHYHDLQINAIARDLRLLPQKPNVIYDSHEAYHLLLRQEDATGAFTSLLNKLFAHLITKWELIKVANCNYIIVTDKYTLEYFEKNLPGIPKSVIYNYSYFLPQTNISDDQKKYDFIYSGMISRKRGIKEIILAIKKCKTYFPNTTLLLIGSFEEENFYNEIIHLIEAHDLTQNIKLIDEVPFSEIGKYYSISRIGLCLLYATPKYSTAIPIKLFEYMAFGLPVIFSNHGPSAKIINNTANGFLVDYCDIDKISKSMKKLLTNKTLYRDFSENGKLAVENKFNWQLEKEKLLSIYEQLLN